LLLNLLTPTKIKMTTPKTGSGCPVEVLSPVYELYLCTPSVLYDVNSNNFTFTLF